MPSHIPAVGIWSCRPSCMREFILMARSRGPAWAGSVPSWTERGPSRRQAGVAAEACRRGQRQERKRPGGGDPGVGSSEGERSHSPANPAGDRGRKGEGNTSSATRRPCAHCPGSRAPGAKSSARTASPPLPVLSGPVTISANVPWAGLSSPHSSLVYALWLGPLGDALGKNSDGPCLN